MSNFIHCKRKVAGFNPDTSLPSINMNKTHVTLTAALCRRDEARLGWAERVNVYVDPTNHKMLIVPTTDMRDSYSLQRDKKAGSRRRSFSMQAFMKDYPWLAAATGRYEPVWDATYSGYVLDCAAMMLPSKRGIVTSQSKFAGTR